MDAHIERCAYESASHLTAGKIGERFLTGAHVGRMQSIQWEFNKAVPCCNTGNKVCSFNLINLLQIKKVFIRFFDGRRQ